MFFLHMLTSPYPFDEYLAIFQDPGQIRYLTRSLPQFSLVPTAHGTLLQASNIAVL